MNQFLSQYAFHTEMDISVFVIAAMCLLVIALLTVTYQAAKAASANPTTSLRVE
jgi:putative ABC transport system permease protein